MEDRHGGTLETIAEVFGDRLRRRQFRPGEDSPDGALATALPRNAGEVELLARVSKQYGVPLVALGAETSFTAPSKEGSILVRFDLMRGLRLPESEELWAEAEPGGLWLELDNNLRARGMGLTVYPTSAPRATVGGWMAQDGLGVGSFEYGWLRENVVSADVVLPGGERRTVRGDDLSSFVGPEGGGIVVGARLRTRRTAGDVPRAFVFEDPRDLTLTVTEVSRAGIPLWHLSFLNEEMAKLRNLGVHHLLFGAYPAERATKVEESLRKVVDACRGSELPSTDAYRVWGERFFPVAPSRTVPVLTERTIIRTQEIPVVLKRLSGKAVQGTIARSGEVLFLAFDAHEQDLPR